MIEEEEDADAIIEGDRDLDLGVATTAPLGRVFMLCQYKTKQKDHPIE